MSNKDSCLTISFWCFVVLIIIIAFAVVYNVGVFKGRAECRVVEVSPEYRTGPAPDGVPVWAVYIERGVLYATSALSTGSVLREFNVHGGPVGFEPLPEPLAWTELSAGIREVLP